MSLVAASEAELLSIARAMVGELDVGAVAPLLRTHRPLAEKQGPTSMRLLERTLAAGAVLQLARRGGWRSKRQLCSGKVAAGRFWELHPDTRLQFGPASVHVLHWMLKNALALQPVPPVQYSGPLTPADELVAYLACSLVTEAECGPALRQGKLFGRSALCWLGFPAQLGGKTGAPPDAERFAELLAGPSAPLVEALQDDLAARWVSLQRSQQHLTAPADLSRLADVQRRLLDAWLDAVEKAGRQDLALFLVDAGAHLLPPGVSGRHFVGKLDGRAPLAERSQARRAAGAFLHVLVRLGGWAEQWKATPFFEDAYAAAQMMLKAWEGFGDERLQRAQAVLRELETLDAGATAPPAGTPPQARAPAATAGSGTT